MIGAQGSFNGVEVVPGVMIGDVDFWEHSFKEFSDLWVTFWRSLGGCAAGAATDIIPAVLSVFAFGFELVIGNFVKDVTDSVLSGGEAADEFSEFSVCFGEEVFLLRDFFFKVVAAGSPPAAIVCEGGEKIGLIISSGAMVVSVVAGKVRSFVLSPPKRIKLDRARLACEASVTSLPPLSYFLFLYERDSLI